MKGSCVDAPTGLKKLQRCVLHPVHDRGQRGTAVIRPLSLLSFLARTFISARWTYTRASGSLTIKDLRPPVWDRRTARWKEQVSLLSVASRKGIRSLACRLFAKETRSTSKRGSHLPVQRLETPTAVSTHVVPLLCRHLRLDKTERVT